MNGLARRLGLQFPLFQAGMGGIAGVDLAAATAEAGAGGVLGLYRSTPSLIADLVTRARQRTTRPLGVNLIPELVGLRTLVNQVDAVLQASDQSLYFTFFGVPEADVAARVKRADRAMLVMVGDVGSMRIAEGLGADAVILQGIEAGGHLLGVQQLDDLVDEALATRSATPLVAAGGIGNGRRFRQLFARGMSGCLCGTLFTATRQSMAHDDFKARLVEAGPGDTVVTRIYDIGWPARRHRVLRNALTSLAVKALPPQFIAFSTIGGRRHPIPRYSAMVPGQRTEGSIAEMAMYCGESVADVSAVLDAGAVVRRFIDEFDSTEHAGVAEGASS